MHQPIYTERRDVHLLPWLVTAGSDGLKRDCFLIATMDGAEMVAVSLHVVAKADEEKCGD